ncbi:hypothetical protein B484DRAFT_432890 [Ochromonadaceae sp. CCMP2298]|nr:hypothetical protein B484DRAFT_432890 [Ochromonadaceae sp. CCMP2298]|mmetsp:Transcript_7395/g.16208  ORF Transcript_7395/g.16208 Transcript_7395/m.16208 type:complete len:497 (+) Transcript_7395:213-1703(+)|eukprot:CAMPEP_0173202538 /NCGR_PEP_ID=MMETSP1141-20130122/19031_1 /TAXON_ID=483371 /ORGANISM="non described non described, Strain CCMP2298" /LENGTH=496 /DNA_ID=CAMNT_0014127919 /DNA_START=158 /DNA_END=1648 /DNA_ORIENTATION=-
MSLSKKLSIAVAAGDGIGPEIMRASIAVLNAVRAPLDYHNVDMGKTFYLSGNSTGMTQAAKEKVEETRILFKGPMETPKGAGMKSINVTARKVWSTYANKRIFKTLPGVETVFSRAGIHVDLTIVRENIEDTYGGVEHMQTHDVAQCRRFITRPGSLQVHRKAFEIAMTRADKDFHRVTCCHKANIMKLTDGLFLEAFHEIAKEYPDVRTDDIIVDDLAMKLVTRPDMFDVIVLPNLQGDIISDLAAGLVGGLGMAPSANIGDDIAIFEAVHGTAPDIAGKGIANPTALILSSCMMLRHLGMHDRAHMIETGLHAALAAGIRTVDLTQAPGMSPASTAAFVEGIIKHLPFATHAAINIPWESPAFKPLRTENEVMVSPPKSVVTVGADMFVNSELPPHKLASAVQAVAPKHLKLTMISNRGTQVWPTGSVLTQCINHYRCRLEFVEPPNPEAQDLGAARSELLQAAAQICATVPVCSLEMLNMVDGKQGFTLAQGQ